MVKFLRQEEVVQFWDKRHSLMNEYSGGDKGLSDSENYEFYVHRLNCILGIIRKNFYGVRHLDILDAGCGKGLFARGFYLAGYKPVGVDSSEFAINECRKNIPQCVFECQDLAKFDINKTFDVAVCIDVLFHIVDDAVWRKVLERIAHALRYDGIMIVSDANFANKITRLGKNGYIVYRNEEYYKEVMLDMGFELCRVIPYNIFSNQNRFMVFRRLR